MTTSRKPDWRWVSLGVVYAIHDRQIAEHGGFDGLRDAGAIEAALARPVNLAAYGDPDESDLAAAYMYGLARCHGFNDGNKRAAWVLARLFLLDNGYTLRFDQFEAIRLVESVAAGSVDQDQAAAWFRERTTKSEAAANRPI